MTTKIYGASDDLIEIEGEVSDEYGCFNHKAPIQINVSDGTKATIFYNGEWKINVAFAGSKYLKKIDSVGDNGKHTGEEKDCSPYSDIMIFEDGIQWVKIGAKTFWDEN